MRWNSPLLIDVHLLPVANVFNPPLDVAPFGTVMIRFHSWTLPKTNMNDTS